MAAGTNCAPMLSRLVELVRQDRLRPPIDDILPWESVGAAAERLAGQGVEGKIVLEVR
jgi:NADPH:quinone reductase-like Zn-dependent oxidoreductase